MKPRFRLFLLGLNLALCVVLALAWMRARQKNHQLSDDLSRVQSEKQSHEKSLTALRLQSDQQLAELAQPQTVPTSSRTPEIIRRELAMQAITRLKQSHAQNPPLPPPKRPPFAPNSGYRFTELMADPEYNRLTFLSLRLTFQTRNEESLRKIGLPPASIEKVLDLMADRYMAALDRRQLLGTSYKPDPSAAIISVLKGDAPPSLNDQIEHEIRALMTDDQHAKFTKLSEPGTPENARSSLSTLAQRLSYSSAPLDTAKIDQLAALLAQQSGPRGRTSQIVNSGTFAESARAILSPEQHTALLQLQAEWQAKQKRGQLPKSSEIPRL